MKVVMADNFDDIDIDEWHRNWVECFLRISLLKPSEPLKPLELIFDEDGLVLEWMV